MYLLDTSVFMMFTPYSHEGKKKKKKKNYIHIIYHTTLSPADVSSILITEVFHRTEVII